LMTHKPHVWRTRGHFVVFYSIIIALLFFLFGLMYPQTLYQLSNEGRKGTNITILINILCFLLALGGVFGWWFSIQKFPYKRTSVIHFFIEVGIYTLGLFALWSVVWAFMFGFFYKRSYQLEKNTAEDKAWFYQNDFQNFGYMPHQQDDKLNNLNNYFSRGEKLIDIQDKREVQTRNERDYFNSIDESFEDRNQGTRLSNLDWEFKTNFNNNKLPPQYLGYSNYFNAVVGKDSLRIAERKRQKNPDDELFFDSFMPIMNYDKIVEATTNTYARYYHHIDFSDKANSLLNKQVKEWEAYSVFLESLNQEERKIYIDLLKELHLYYKDYDSIMVSIKQPLLVAYSDYVRRQYEHNGGINYDRTHDVNSYDIISDNQNSVDFGNSDMNTIAGEKYDKALSKMDKNSASRFNLYLSNCEAQFSKKNIKDKNIASILDNTYTTLKPNQLDSLLLFDYYYLNLKNYDSYSAFFTKAYVDYVCMKYTNADFDRLHNLLIVNGFEDKTPQYLTSKIQKIELLQYADEYKIANNELESFRKNFANQRLLLWSPFSLVYCLLIALVFYILTLSTSTQFWISSFISGIYGIIMVSVFEIFRFKVYDSSKNSTYNLYYSFMMVHVVLFLILIISLYLSKHQWQKAHIRINTLVISGLGATLSASLFWQDLLREAMIADNNFKYSEFFYIKITTNVFLIAILIYGIIAWLFKRHLTYPKKK
jgi:hypothetical protein